MSGGGASRRKGLAGEHESAQLWREHGWSLRGLEGSGDWLAFRPEDYPGNGAHRTMHVETKRQERLRLPEWLHQADTEAPPGVPAVVCFRQNRAEWYAALRLSALLELIS